MFDIENSDDIERVSRNDSMEDMSSLSDYEKDYVKEILPLNNLETSQAV